MTDLLSKWTKECTTVEEIWQKVATEQLLNTLPGDVRIWVSERKPKTAEQAGQLADDYVQARGRSTEDGKRELCRGTGKHTLGSKRCHNCGRMGHLARDCHKVAAGRMGESGAKEPNLRQEERDGPRCYSCHRKGHIAAKCPNRAAMFCEEGYVGKQSDQITRSGEAEVARHGIVEGVPVGDIVVDTGSSRTLVRCDLVPKEKMTGGEVPVRCAHGDIVSYPLAQVEIRVGGSQYLLEAEVSERLPVAVLLGRDVPGLANLLNRGSRIKDTEQVEEAMAVTTRAQRQREEKEAANCAEREQLSGLQPHSIVQNVEGPWQESQEGLEQGQEKLAAESDGCPGGEWDEEIFTASRERAKLTKRQKRINKKQYRRDTEQQALAHPLDLTAEELRDMQEKDDSLAAVRKAATGGVSTAGTGFFEREGLLYR